MFGLLYDCPIMSFLPRVMPAAVGKSSIRTAFGGGPFHPRHDMTIGVEFDSKIINVDGVPIRISLYDAVCEHL